MHKQGKCEGAPVRLWQHELPTKFELVKLGDKIRVARGAFAGQVFRVVGKLTNQYDRFVYCDHVDNQRAARPRV